MSPFDVIRVLREVAEQQGRGAEFTEIAIAAMQIYPELRAPADEVVDDEPDSRPR